MVFDGRPASALSADMRDPQGALSRMPGEEAAFDEIAERARLAGLAGRAVAEALGAYDWRRAEDVPGAASVMQGLEMAFEDMAAMRDANLLRKEIDGSIRPGPSRPGMPL